MYNNGKEAFDIHDTYINVVIPFNKNVMDTLSFGKTMTKR